MNTVSKMNFFGTLKFFLIYFLFSSLLGCNDLVTNSNTNDANRFKTTFDGGSNFQLIMPTIANKCATCHEHSEWLNFSELDFETAGYVVRGNPTNSSIYYRLSNALVGRGPRNMPQGGESAFTDEEIALLEDWINGFTF